MNKWSQFGSGVDSISVDTTSLSNRINDKIDSIKRISDWVYFKKNGEWNYSYKDSVGSFDSTSLSNRINLKLNISDTTNKWVNYIYRIPGKDSIFYRIGNTIYGIKDSIGAGGGGGQNGRFGNDTATVIMAKIHNDAGVQLTKGKVVYLSPSGSSSDVPSVKLASNKADSCSANTFGFVTGTIAINDTGYIVIGGKIEKINTSAFANGDILYLDSIAGNFTKTKPQAPYHIVYLGAVIKANTGNGAIEVKIQNGWELTELHDVQINGKLNNQILVYSDTQKVWKNRNIYSVIDTATLFAPYVHYSDTATMLSAYLKKADSTLYQTKYRTDTMRTNIYNAIKGPVGTDGDLQYRSGSGFGSSEFLHWNYDENRLGIGNSDPHNKLDVGEGGGLMYRGLYEASSFSTNGDTKVGIYSNNDEGIGGASLVFGQTGITNENDLFNGFEEQYVSNLNNPEESYLTFNSLLRDYDGSVVGAGGNLFTIYAGGQCVIDGTNYGIATNPSLLVNGTGRFNDVLTTTGQRLAYRYVSTSTSLNYDEHFILANTQGDGDINITLPIIVTGQTYIIKKQNDEQIIWLIPQSGDLIDDASEYKLDTQYQYVEIIGDINNSNWWIIGKN